MHTILPVCETLAKECFRPIHMIFQSYSLQKLPLSYFEEGFCIAVYNVLECHVNIATRILFISRSLTNCRRCVWKEIEFTNQIYIDDGKKDSLTSF